MKREMGELELNRNESGRSGERPGAEQGGAAGCGMPQPRAQRALGIGDDCAILASARGQNSSSPPTSPLEGRHFRRTCIRRSAGHGCWPAASAIWPAMGARPLAAFLPLLCPAEMLATRAGTRVGQRFFAGLRALATARRTAGGRPIPPIPQRSGAGGHRSDRIGPAGRALRPVVALTRETRSTSPANWVARPPSSPRWIAAPLLIRPIHTKIWVPHPFRVLCGMGGSRLHSLPVGESISRT